MEKNKRNISISLKYRIQIIHIFIIINIIYMLKSQGGGGNTPGQQEEIFKVLISKKYDLIFKFSNLRILSYNASCLSQITQTQLMLNLQYSQEAKMISLSETISDNDSFQKIYITVKNYLYIFKNDGTFVKNTQIQNMENYLPSIVITDECDISSNIITLFIALIDANKKIKIYLIKHTTTNNEISFENDQTINIINSSGDNSWSQSDFVSCQIMYANSDEKYLTCFFENENSEIGTLNLNTENLVTIATKPSQFRKNSGAQILKSVLYSNRSKAFVCYINTDNECACLSFDIIENKWSNYESKYLEGCTMEIFYFSFDYFEKSNEYILTCFSSLNEFNSILFNANMELRNKLNENRYCISNNLIHDCNDEPLQSSINNFNSDTSYKIIISCAMRDFDQIYVATLSEICTSSELIILNSYSTITSFPIESTTINFPSEELSNSYSNKLQSDNIKYSVSNIYDNYLSFPQETLLIPISQNALDIINPKNEIIKKISDKTKEDLSNNLDQLMKDVEIGKVYEIQGDDYEVKISPINFNDYEGSSTYINFLECENTLRMKNIIPQDSILTVIQIEIYKYDEKSLTNQLEYAVYNDKKIKLDLSVCDKDKIEINYVITNISALDLEKISFFSDMNVDIFNSKDEFFNDICFSYSENNSDMILKDRISNIYQNYSLCDNNCEYNNINITSNLISCYCNIKSEIETQKPPLKFNKIYLDLFSETTFGVIKCFNLVFSSKNKLNNIGFLIFSVLIFLHIQIIIYYIFNGINTIILYLFSEMKKFNYLPQINSPLKKKKKSIFKIHSNKKFENETILKNTQNNNKWKRSKRNIFKNDQNSINVELLSSNNKLKNVVKDENLQKQNENFIIKTSNNNNIIQPIVIINNQKNNKNIFKLKNIKNSKKIIKKINQIEKKLETIKTQNNNNYFLIKIDAKNTINYSSHESKFFLDNFNYEDAIIYDKRPFWRLYLICLFAKENIINTFFIYSPLDLKQ